MTVKTMTAVACVLAAALAHGGAKWKNLNDKAHVGGPKIAETDLLGKAVFVFYWDAAEPDSVKLLPEVEKVWDSFKTKKFAVVGNYMGKRNDAKAKALMEKYKVTFPVYAKFSMDPDPKPGFSKPPYYNVVSHRGVGRYNGGGFKAAQAEAVNAISAVGMPVSLCEGVEFKKFKSLEKQLALGKNISTIVKKLEKAKEGKDPTVTAEAQEILSAIENGMADVKSDIEAFKEADPAEAMNLIQLFMKTWPKDEASAEYKAMIPDLKKAAAEKLKAEKEKARERMKDRGKAKEKAK